MTVSADRIGKIDNGHQTYTVSVSNANPKCRVRMSIGGASATKPVHSDGTASADLVVKLHPGQARVVARTVGCKGATEVAVTRITISRNHSSGPRSVRHGEDCRVRADGWLPRRTVVMVATDGRHTIRKTVRTDKHGNADLRFRPGHRGSWTVILIQNGRSSHFEFHVR